MKKSKKNKKSKLSAKARNEMELLLSAASYERITVVIESDTSDLERYFTISDDNEDVSAPELTDLNYTVTIQKGKETPMRWTAHSFETAVERLRKALNAMEIMSEGLPVKGKGKSK